MEFPTTVLGKDHSGKNSSYVGQERNIKMKNVIFVAGLCLVLSGPSVAGGEEKQVCTDVKDAKGNVIKKADGTPKQTCKKIKVHKKFEGEKVPDGKK